MKYRYIRAFIVLLAGLLTIIINIKTNKNVTVSLLLLLIVLIIFYFIGTLVTEILQHFIEKDESEPELTVVGSNEPDEPTEEKNSEENSFEDDEE